LQSDNVCMKKIKSFLIVCLLGAMVMSCSSSKDVCKQNVKPADVWYKNKNSGKAYR